MHLPFRWFGLILLPIVSFAADGTVALVYYVRYTIRHYFHEPTPPQTLAKAEAIDLSIQFVLFWMPFLVLLAWWTNKPLTMLFGMSTFFRRTTPVVIYLSVPPNLQIYSR